MKKRIQEPLRFKREFLKKVWGGRALADSPEVGGLGLVLPDGIPIGETWELVDRKDVNSVVAAGSFAGARLEELMADKPGDLLGDMPATSGGRFPLLVKYIDAAKHLSVQVHPAEREDFEPKTEAWVILSSTQTGRIFHGFAPGVQRRDFEQALNTGEAIEPLLRSFRPKPGECFFVPGGTVHAIGAGVTLIEVQENSDTTFRINDWGRMGLDGKPRELHVEEALACLNFGAAPKPTATSELCHKKVELVTCTAFSMSLVDVTTSLQATTASRGNGAPVVLAAVRGSGSIESAAGDFPVTLGDVILLPAALGAFRVHSSPLGQASPLRLINMRGPAPVSEPA